ncbi:hypothetical protein PFISCL1PPCAC_27876, partial [Pristionchus fissidentatus]
DLRQCGMDSFRDDVVDDKLNCSERLPIFLLISPILDIDFRKIVFAQLEIESTIDRLEHALVHGSLKMNVSSHADPRLF